jgi:hypothetical protein
MGHGIAFFAYAHHNIIQLLYFLKSFASVMLYEFFWLDTHFSGTNSMMSGSQKKILKRHLKSSMGVRKR